MPSQFARPRADVSGFADYTPNPVWAELDEVTPDDVDFVRTTASPLLRLSLSLLTGPFSSSTATMRMRARNSAPGIPRGNFLMRLMRTSNGAQLVLSSDYWLGTQELAASFTTLTHAFAISALSGFENDLDVRFDLDGNNGNHDISWFELEAPPVSVVTGPLPPILHTPYPQQTYGGTVVPILWSYSTFSGPGSQTTPSVDISFSTNCGTSWSTLSSGIAWTSTITLTGYAWDSTDSAMTVTNCARVRIRESNDTPSSWVTSGALFPPRIWIPPPISTATESWSRETISVATWTVSECATAQTWVAPSIDSATWSVSGCSSAMTWFSIGI